MRGASRVQQCQQPAEVAGDAALLTPPYDDETLAAAVRLIVSQPALAAEMPNVAGWCKLHVFAGKAPPPQPPSFIARRQRLAKVTSAHRPGDQPDPRNQLHNCCHKEHKERRRLSAFFVADGALSAPP